jgi:hypothetical protein
MFKRIMDCRAYLKTGQTNRQKMKKLWVFWLLPITGFFVLLWFLVRVIPKPSRAFYPCQRATFPMAAGFVAWLVGLFGATLFLKTARQRLYQRRYVAATICILVTVLAVLIPLYILDLQPVLAEDPRLLQTANDPRGIARGIHPGRVVWVHDPGATEWNGPGDGHWFEDEHTDQTRVEEMLSRAVQALAGSDTDEAAWNRLFAHFNLAQGRGERGYLAGEKIAIKVNLTLAASADPVVMDQDSQYIDFIETSPQLTIALLEQLIQVAGVNPEDITIGDPGRIMPNFWYDKVHGHPGLGNVVYLGRVGGLGRTSAKYSSEPFYWSDPDSAHKNGVSKQDYVPVSIADADYLINFAVMKSHDSSGVTLCGKNHYGSLIRNPTAWEQPDSSAWYNMHLSRICAEESPGMGHYRAIVDLMGHESLGGKTLLYMVDGLFAGEWWEGKPSLWNMAPFSGDWPSSIFLSQDGVAVDSVCFDFLLEEWPKNGEGSGNPVGPNSAGSDDYLHEAALASAPPSGTFYDPEDDGVVMMGLGVHEHWNNPVDKLYTRNMGTGAGIELIALRSPYEGDIDCDGVSNGVDNCPLNCNSQQLDIDSDGIGDVCDADPGCGGCGQPTCEKSCDIDTDCILNTNDNCPNNHNTQQFDADNDTIGDVCDDTPGCGGCGQPDCEQ